MPVPRKDRLYKNIDNCPDVLMQTPYTKTLHTKDVPFAVYWPKKFSVYYVKTVCRGARAVLRMRMNNTVTWHVVHLKPTCYRSLNPYVLQDPLLVRDSYTYDKNGPIGFSFASREEALYFIKTNDWLNQ